ncbi:unnamed protein product [Rhizophagus irregularis]|nr:unnamed protein product [Rhizophagus irregularis]
MYTRNSILDRFFKVLTSKSLDGMYLNDTARAVTASGCWWLLVVGVVVLLVLLLRSDPLHILNLNILMNPYIT